MHEYPGEKQQNTSTMAAVVSHTREGGGPATLVCLDTVADPRNAFREVKKETTTTVTQGGDTPDSNKAYADLNNRPRYVSGFFFK